MTQAGDRVELLSMSNDPNPIPSGMQGTVQHIDGGGTVHVTWDNGRNLGMIPGTDVWRVIYG